MIVDEKWIDWVESTSIAAVSVVYNIICNDDFWRDADALQAALLPIVCVLQLCDSTGSTISLLYEFMERLRRATCDCTVLNSDRVQEILDIFETRWAWFKRLIHCVVHILHPSWRSDAHRSDRVLLSGWNTYVERIFRDNGAIQNRLEEDLLGVEETSTDLLQKMQTIWLSPSLGRRSLEAPPHPSVFGFASALTRGELIRLNTPQLDKLAYVNANLHVLEKVGALEDVGVVSWLPKQVDHCTIKVDAADISSPQPHCAEDDAYDFIREDMMTFSRQTRSTTRRLRGVTNDVMDCSSGPCKRNWSTWVLFDTKKRNRLSTAQLERLVYCHCNLHLLDHAATSPEPRQVNVDKIDIEKVKDIPNIPREELDIYTMLYEEMSAPAHQTRASSRRSRSAGGGASTSAIVPSPFSLGSADEGGDSETDATSASASGTSSDADAEDGDSEDADTEEGDQ
ncbi:hypothetical protein L7F22_055435 [Adiantum nelumboides]|nr:hypothetical protein [Adiantum nelumboides]